MTFSNFNCWQDVLRRWVPVLVVLGLMSAPSASFAQQQPDNKGTEFWLMFLPNNSTPQNLDLFITGDVATSGTVEILGVGFSQVFTVTPGNVTTVALPVSISQSTSEVVNDTGVRVTADDEVTVYGLNQRSFTTDAYLGLPVDILGTEYINLGYENVGIVNGTEFGIVATTDNSIVTIVPSTNAGTKISGVPFTVNMNRGQTYVLISTDGPPADLTGSTITSNFPIGVFGGHRCANIPAGFTFCDHIEEQLPPVSTWGQSFVTFPLATRIGGDTFRILASEAGTAVTINGAVVATLNRGEFHEAVIDGAATITSTGPVLVAQYSNSTSFDNVTSDPFQALVPPSEQFLASYVVSTPETGFLINYINIVAPDASLGSVVLDGTNIPASEFTPIGSSGFSGTSQEVDLGSHALAGPLPFGVLSYGFNEADSYGYPGGLALAEVAELRGLDLQPENSSANVNEESCVVATVSDQNGDPLAGIRVTFDALGSNSASGFTFSDASGEAEFCYTGTIVGSDIITATSGSLVDTAMKNWVGVSTLQCDVDLNGIVDRSDIQSIFSALGQNATGPDDPRDSTGDGVIAINDGRACVLQCTNARCAP